MSADYSKSVNRYALTVRHLSRIPIHPATYIEADSMNVVAS